MKQSSAGSMSEPKEVELQKLCIDLCNLIVESRIPGVNERGYGVGMHCPPHMGDNTHKCDPAKVDCQKHLRMVKHLLRAVDRGIFEIDVLLLPDCCNEPMLNEKIQSQEYRLLERWSMKCSHEEKNSNIEVPQLLRAVSSFLHFSQISAWLSSTKGKLLRNVYYWVKPNLEPSGAKFEHEPEVHTFPICKLTDSLLGSVQVKHISRSQYIPVIPCSKHPPIANFALRTIQEDTNICRTIPLNSQVIRQLHKTCDNFQTPLISKTFVPENTSLVLSPTTVLKTFSDSKRSSRILKHSNSQSDLVNTSNLSLELSQDSNINVISESQAAYMCDTLTKRAIQENVCFRQRLIMKVKKLKREVSTSLGFGLIPTTSGSSGDVKCNIVYPVSSVNNTDSSDISSTNMSTFFNPHSSLNVGNLKQMKFRHKKGNPKKRKESPSNDELSSCHKRPCTVANCSSHAQVLLSTSVSSNIPSRFDAISNTGCFENFATTSNTANTKFQFPNTTLSSGSNESNQNGKWELVCSANEPNKRKAVELEELSENSSKNVQQLPSAEATSKMNCLNVTTGSLEKRRKMCIANPAHFDFSNEKNTDFNFKKRSSTYLNPSLAEENSKFLHMELIPEQKFSSCLSLNIFENKQLKNRAFFCKEINEKLECFPNSKLNFPKGKKLLGNFEESILRGCLPVANSVEGFRVEIGASGSFCPNHLTLPANVTFYDLGNSHQVATPYVAHVALKENEYYLPKKGVVQLTLFNPSGTVVKMFVLNYDMSNMPPMCHTFIREKTYYLPVGSTEENPSSQKWLRFIIHLRFASSKTGRIFLHEDFKIVVLNKSNDDAASEFNQEPRELRSFLSVPMNPTFSNF